MFGKSIDQLKIFPPPDHLPTKLIHRFLWKKRKLVFSGWRNRKPEEHMLLSPNEKNKMIHESNFWKYILRSWKDWNALKMHRLAKTLMASANTLELVDSIKTFKGKIYEMRSRRSVVVELCKGIILQFKLLDGVEKIEIKKRTFRRLFTHVVRLPITRERIQIAFCVGSMRWNYKYGWWTFLWWRMYFPLGSLYMPDVDEQFDDSRII